MQLRDFLRAGHWPTLPAAFVYFDVSFMVWVLLGGLANHIASDLHLNYAERGLLVATPLLGGAVLRLVLGWLADKFGARRTALIGLTLTFIPLLLGWLWGNSLVKLLVVGLLLGVAGASFAVALPLAGRWYPPRYQGLALGIAGAGNSGTALATFFAPRLATTFGWPAVFGLALVPVSLAWLVVWSVAREAPQNRDPASWGSYLLIIREKDMWWLSLFYLVTFGGFVGLASFLNIYFRTQYELSPIAAGNLATICVLAGSFLRPVGGYLADRLGGVRVLVVLYLGVAGLLGWLSVGVSAILATASLTVVMGLLGMGNGAVFQLVPQRFPKQMGTITGIVGAAGGLGGFLLPTALGSLKELTGTFGGGFLAMALLALFCAGAIVLVTRAWYGIYISAGGLASLPATLASQTLVAQEEAG